VLSHLNVDHLPAEEDNRHVLRVGFSASSASIQLGKVNIVSVVPRLRVALAVNLVAVLFDF